jgi:FK506-binding protein 4/5
MFPTILKKQTRSDNGIGPPAHFANVTVKVSVVGPQGEELVPVREDSFELSSGAHCEALESALRKMVTESAATVTVEDVSICQDARLDLRPTCGPITFHVELLRIESPLDPRDMPNAAKIIHCEKLKSRGAAYVKQNEWRRAGDMYAVCCNLLCDLERWKDDEKMSGESLRTACELNMALCWLKLQLWQDCTEICSEILETEGHNIKALYRRGLALVELKQFRDALRDFNVILELDASNREAKKAIATVERLVKTDKKREAGLMKKMMSDTGKGSFYREEKRDTERSLREAILNTPDVELNKPSGGFLPHVGCQICNQALENGFRKPSSHNMPTAPLKKGFSLLSFPSLCMPCN